MNNDLASVQRLDAFLQEVYDTSQECMDHLHQTRQLIAAANMVLDHLDQRDSANAPVQAVLLAADHQLEQAKATIHRLTRLSMSPADKFLLA